MSKCKALPDQARLRELFDYDPDTGWLIRKVGLSGPNAALGSRAGTAKPGGRRQVRIDGHYYQEHRVIWMWWYGEDPGELVIDHINCDPSDNRINNLRVVTHTQNLYNWGSRKCHYRGVTLIPRVKKDKYRAAINHDHQLIYLGTYATLEEAIEARQSAELQYWGELSDSTVK